MIVYVPSFLLPLMDQTSDGSNYFFELSCKNNANSSVKSSPPDLKARANERLCTANSKQFGCSHAPRPGRTRFGSGVTRSSTRTRWRSSFELSRIRHAIQLLIWVGIGTIRENLTRSPLRGVIPPLRLPPQALPPLEPWQYRSA